MGQNRDGSIVYLELAKRWYDEAVRWVEEHNPRDGELRRVGAESAGLLGLKDELPMPDQGGSREARTR